MEAEAAKRGLRASEYALRLIEAMMKPNTASDATEQARLDAIDELMGAGADSSFESADLRRERDEERAMEDERHARRLGPEASR